MITHKMTTVNVVTTFLPCLIWPETSLNLIEEVVVMKAEYRDQYRKFGLNVVYYRKAMRKTQLQLAEMLDIERSHISAIELGNVGVSMDLIFKMSEVFGIKPKDLFDFRD